MTERGALGAWNRYWFSPVQLETLGLVRIFVTLTFLMKLVGAWGLWKGWDGLRFRWPSRHTYAYGDFVNAVPGFEWLPVPTLAQLRTGEEVVLYASLLFCVGLFTRVSGAVVAGGLLWFLLGSQWNYLHHVNVYTWVFVLLALAPSGDHFSLDAALRRGWAKRQGRTHTPPLRPILWQRAFVVFLSILYAATTAAKLGPGWFEGQVMEMMVNRGWTKGYSDLIVQVVSPKVLAWWTIVAEGMLAFGLLFPRTRRFAAWCGFALHLGIDLMMNVTTFSYLMVSLYLTAGSPRVGQTVVSVDPARTGHRVAAGLVRALDWCRRIRVQPGASGPLSVALPSGAVHTGGRAALALLARSPLTYLAAFPVDAAVGLWTQWRRPASA